MKIARPTTAAEIRQAFLDYFEEKGHTRVASAPLVPHGDDTLLFVNAGMVPFKDTFLGLEKRPYLRATSSQKCMRVSGKHNDLEEVGPSPRHHTFFEMLGNWSFGDYFKAESIAWGFELLTKTFGIPADRLYATYFRGEPSLGLEPDHEARDLWLRHLPPSHVLPGSMKDNFWEMGETGPCGPCSEIHYDRVGGRDAGTLVNTGDPDVLEIWNHVFIQFNREMVSSPPPPSRGPGDPPVPPPSTRLVPLPARHVDTGMGLERLVSVLQNVRSNYDTDLFAPIFAAIERLTGARPYMGRVGAADEGNVDTAYRVVADHVRCLTFALTDGAVPGNEGRGYVLRRILRRAVRFGRQMLGARTGFLSRLVPAVVDKMGDAFPELRNDPDRVERIIREEEESFGKTLDRGIGLFEEAATRARSLAAHDAFKLYDTYGFPIDLTVLMARERGITVDVAGFEKLMEEARERSRAGAKEGGEAALALSADAIARLRHMHVAPTDDADKFHGRDIRATVKAIWNGENFDDSARAGSAGLRPIGVILDRTNFYAEMGGQVADHGRLVEVGEHVGGATPVNAEFEVADVRAFGGYVLHAGRVTRGELRVGETVLLHVDHARRGPIAANHTATHLLNFALRRVLGAHVDQKGSLVAPDRLRFDFTNAGPVTPEQIEEVEGVVRGAIAADLPVYADTAALPVARRIAGLRAVFGEAYPDPVRVVSIGRPVAELIADPGNLEWNNYSVELCGGTHLPSTGAAGAFAVVHEESVAKGIRRVVALTGVPARAAIAAAEGLARRVAEAGTLAGDDLQRELAAITHELDQLTLPVPEKARIRAGVSALAEKVKAAAKQAAAGRRHEAAMRARQAGQAAREAGDRVVVATLELGSDRGAIEQAVRTIRDLCPHAAVMVLSLDEGKVSVMAGVPDAAVKAGLNAGEWVRETAKVLGGKGGGRPDAAQGAGPDVPRVADAARAARAFAEGRIKTTTPGAAKQG